MEIDTSKVTPVDGFMTTDGQFYLTENEAKAHQHVLDMHDDIEVFSKGQWDPWNTTVAVRLWEEHRKFKELEGDKK